MKTKFPLQLAKELGPDELSDLVASWQKNNKSRLHHAKLLKFETLQSNKKLMAAYLGFSHVPQLLHFVDFICKFIFYFEPPPH